MKYSGSSWNTKRSLRHPRFLPLVNHSGALSLFFKGVSASSIAVRLLPDSFFSASTIQTDIKQKLRLQLKLAKRKALNKN